jgi:hypothetical protein
VWFVESQVSKTTKPGAPGNLTRDFVRILPDMQGEKKERWLKLCEQAANEQDPNELLKLVREINDLLEEKERRLGIKPPKP